MIRERDEDADHDDMVQRELEDKEDSKRFAAGISAEELSLRDSYIEGQRAGHLNMAAGLNPYQDGCPEHDAWERGRLCVIGLWLNGVRKKL